MQDNYQERFSEISKTLNTVETSIQTLFSDYAEFSLVHRLKHTRIRNILMHLTASQVGYNPNELTTLINIGFSYATYLSRIIQKMLPLTQLEINEIFSMIESNYKNLLEVIKPSELDLQLGIAESMRQKLEFQKEQLKNLAFERESLERVIEEFRTNARQSGESVNKLRDKLQNEFDRIKEEYADVLAKGKVLVDSNGFQNISASNLVKARKWQYGIITIVSLVLVVTAILICITTKSDLNPDKQVLGSNANSAFFYFKLTSIFLLKIFFVSILVYMLKFSIKNYNALMHTATINSHKQNALSASLLIIEQLKLTPEQQNAVIARAAIEIFSHHKTGYLAKDDFSMDLSAIKAITDRITQK